MRAKQAYFPGSPGIEPELLFSAYGRLRCGYVSTIQPFQFKSYQEYQGLENQSTFYPYSSAGNTFTTTCGQCFTRQDVLHETHLRHTSRWTFMNIQSNDHPDWYRATSIAIIASFDITCACLSPLAVIGHHFAAITPSSPGLLTLGAFPRLNPCWIEWACCHSICWPSWASTASRRNKHKVHTQAYGMN